MEVKSEHLVDIMALLFLSRGPHSPRRYDEMTTVPAPQRAAVSDSAWHSGRAMYVLATTVTDDTRILITVENNRIKVYLVWQQCARPCLLPHAVNTGHHSDNNNNHTNIKTTPIPERGASGLYHLYSKAPTPQRPHCKQSLQMRQEPGC